MKNVLGDLAGSLAIFNDVLAIRESELWEGDKALLVYDVSKVDEYSNPLDPTSEKTGNVNFILAEIYASQAGVDDHFAQAKEGWSEFPNFIKWIGECKSTVIPSATVFTSLW